VGEAYMTFALEHPHTYKLMFDLNQPDEQNYPELVKAGLRARETMSGYVKDQVSAGLMQGDPEEIGRMFWAATHSAPWLLEHGPAKLACARRRRGS
jgi:hypothetical protein